MARQPIYDRTMRLHAYELLFRRSGADHTAGEMDEEQAATSLVNTLIDIGLKELIGEATAFINVSQELLMSGAITMLPKDRVVLELLETIDPTDEVIQRVRQLQADGFTIALDDYEYTPENSSLLDFASIVKLDVLEKQEAQIRLDLSRVKRPGMKVLAERVETQDQFRTCERAGFDYFQGYFFAKPEMMRGSRAATNPAILMLLASKMQDPSVKYSELEEIISTDVTLTYRLMKFVKSAHFGLDCQITSLKHALVFLGINTVSAIAAVLAMSSQKNKPTELLTTALVRAKMCELLAKKGRKPQPDRYFTIGLFSVLDALLDAPMASVLEQLPLAADLNDALLNPESEEDLAAMLRTVLAFERGDWDTYPAKGVSASDVSNAYQAAVCWAGQAESALAA